MSEKGEDTKSRQPYYTVNWAAVSALVGSYDIFGDVREAAEALDLFVEGLTGAPMEEEEVFGWVGDIDDAE